MPKGNPGLNASGWQREHWGYIVTFIKNGDGKIRTGHQAGRGALAALCDRAVERDPTYRVVCISSPLTIFSDLLGRSKGKNETVLGPEAILLGYAGRRHMLHPDLIGSSRSTERRRHGW